MTAIFKALVAVFAIVLILVGLVLTPTPLPLGIILVAIGFALLVNVWPAPIRWLRKRWAWFDRLLRRIERASPEPIARDIRRTESEEENKDESDEIEDEKAHSLNSYGGFIARLKRARR